MNQKLQQIPQPLSDDDDDNLQKVDFLHEKFEEILEKHPELTADQAFYFQYCKLYINTIKVQSEVKEALSEIEKLKNLSQKNTCKIRKNTTSNIHNDTSNSERRKRIRRTANQIARHYICRIQKCQKSYGSEGSLNQHMKIKHKELFDSAGLLIQK